MLGIGVIEAALGAGGVNFGGAKLSDGNSYEDCWIGVGTGLGCIGEGGGVGFGSID